MTPRPTIAPGQVWRRPSGHWYVTDVTERDVRLYPVARSGPGWVRAYGYDVQTRPLRIAGGRGWQLVAEGVADPREAT